MVEVGVIGMFRVKLLLTADGKIRVLGLHEDIAPNEANKHHALLCACAMMRELETFSSMGI